MGQDKLKNIKLIKSLPRAADSPLSFNINNFDENRALALLNEVIEKANEVIHVIGDAFRGDWTKDPTTAVRAVFGHWLVNAFRHFRATIILCKEFGLSSVADVHSRQIFEIFLQVRYYASFTENEKENIAEKISAIGCIDVLDKLSILQDHEGVSKGYKEISERLGGYSKNILKEIYDERRKGKYNWFGRSFSQLARDVSRSGEDLSRKYKLLSGDAHGTWDLALDVSFPSPGQINFRGYPDDTTYYIRTIDTLIEVMEQYMKVWNEIADSVGATKVFFIDES